MAAKCCLTAVVTLGIMMMWHIYHETLAIENLDEIQPLTVSRKT